MSEGVARAKISENFRKFRAVGGLRGPPTPKIGFERKDPGFSRLMSCSGDPEILTRFHQWRKKLGLLLGGIDPPPHLRTSVV